MQVVGDSAGQRILLRLATVRDAVSTGDVLRRAGLDSTACADIAQAVADIRSGAGALLVAEEVLPAEDLKQLVDALAEQPPWSDLPVLLLARQGADSPAMHRVVAQLPNVTVIERPLRIASLVSALHSTLRARRRQYQVRALLADLQESDRRKTEFLATLAHELRNPLAPLSATLALLELKDNIDAAELRRLHDVMRRQVRHMAGLIDELMEVSRVTRGKIDLARARVALDTVLRDAIEQGRPLITAARHRLTMSVGPEPLVVDGDTKRLVQIVSNLLNNAAKYTPPGGNIELRLRREASDAVLEVQDDGVGMSPEMLQRAFDMFAQADSTKARAQGGLGIGLTLVRKLVELHGGRVDATSPGLGQGSTFTVTLPLAPTSDGPHEPARAAHAAPDFAGRVLIVDDNRDAADALAELLIFSGAEVTTAYTGAQALQRFERGSFDAAVLDIGLPDMDGCQLAQQVRQLPQGAELLLIALTGWGQPEDKERIEAAGFDHHLVKPTDLASLQMLLKLGRPAAKPAPQRS